MAQQEEIRLPWPGWKIVKYLGSGTYGAVYEIERTVAGIRERAAVKVISRPKDAEELEACYSDGYDRESLAASYDSEIRNYVQEYRLMKELQGQSNVVSCDDFTVVPNADGIGGTIFLRMELLTSLQQVLRERMLSEQEIVRLGKDISRALILCESRQIIHRDIKPANIMISQFGDFKLGDFGVAKIMDYRTYATAMGTPEYQAPEVVHMEKYDRSADLYSLGITLYWLLNNRKMPFIGADERITPDRKEEAKERRYRGDRLPEPKYGSPKLKQIVLKACEYRPEDRYSSAKELYEELDQLRCEKTAENDGTAKERDLHQAIFAAEEEQGGEKTVSEIAGRTAGNEQKGSDSWGASFRTAAPNWEEKKIPGEGAHIYKDGKWKKVNVCTADEIKDFEGVFGQLFGNGETKTAGAETVGRKHQDTAGQRNQKKQQDPNAAAQAQAEAALAKISGKENKNGWAGNLGTVFLLGGIVMLFGLAALWYIWLCCAGLGIWLILWEDNVRFKKWLKQSKAAVGQLDTLIQSNPVFGERLYYQKYPDTNLLEYMEKLNPDLARRIKAAKK